MSNADELMVSEKTAYNYLNAGLFDADKTEIEEEFEQKK